MGFEPTYDGFANRCLTTWPPRHLCKTFELSLASRQTLLPSETTFPRRRSPSTKGRGRCHSRPLRKSDMEKKTGSQPGSPSRPPLFPSSRASPNLPTIFEVRRTRAERFRCSARPSGSDTPASGAAQPSGSRESARSRAPRRRAVARQSIRALTYLDPTWSRPVRRPRSSRRSPTSTAYGRPQPARARSSARSGCAPIRSPDRLPARACRPENGEDAGRRSPRSRRRDRDLQMPLPRDALPSASRGHARLRAHHALRPPLRNRHRRVDARASTMPSFQDTFLSLSSRRGIRSRRVCAARASSGRECGTRAIRLT